MERKYKKIQTGIDKYNIMLFVANQYTGNYTYVGTAENTDTDYQNYIQEGNEVEEIDPQLPTAEEFELMKQNKINLLRERTTNNIINTEINGRKLDIYTQRNADKGYYGEEFTEKMENVINEERGNYHQKKEIILNLNYNDNNSINEKFEILEQLTNI